MKLLPYIFTILLFMPLFALGQNKEKPDWILKNPPKPSNNTFSYKVVRSSDRVQANAKKGCLKELVDLIERDYNIRVTGDIKTVSTSKTEGKGTTETVGSEYVYTYRIESGSIDIRIKKVDEYYELVSPPSGGRKVFVYYALYAVGNMNMQPRFDDVTFTYKYGADALWRSMIAPGYGQLYKGSTAKGLSIIGGEVLFVGGIIYGENLRASYRRKASGASDVKKIRSYTDSADNYETVRNICIGGAAAVYLYNLIDAVASDGRRKTVVNKRYSLSPTVHPDYNGISLTFNF